MWSTVSSWCCRCFGSMTDPHSWFHLPFPFILLFLQLVSEKSKSSWRNAAQSLKSNVLCSPTCSDAHLLPSSRRTSGPAKRCRSPFRNSSDWSSQPWATSSWTPAVAAWTVGTKNPAPALASLALQPPPFPRLEHPSKLIHWNLLGWAGLILDALFVGHQTPMTDDRSVGGPCLLSWVFIFI